MTILDSYVKKALDSIEKVQADELEFKTKAKKTDENTESQEESNQRKVKELEEMMKNGSRH